MPNPKRKYTIEEARAYAKKNPEAYNKALDKINPDPYRGTKKFAELLINQYPDRFKGLKPENFLSMLDSIAKAESPEGNVIQKSYNKKTKKYYDGPARGYFQIETSTAPIAQKRYQNYQDILKPLTAVPLPDINVPASGDVRSLSRDEQARLALANMSATAAAKKEKLNPLDSQNSWLNFHWNGSPADKPARQQHWKETFGYGGGGAVGGKLRNQVEPTRADSLDLLNNTKSLENYYSKYNKSYSSAQDASEVNVHYLNKNSADTFFTSGASVKVPRKDGTSMDLKRELFPKDQYYKKVDNNRYYQRELADRILDTRAPMALYDKRIAPNNLTAYLNDIPNDGMNGDGITIYGYDPLSVTPWDMLNSKDKANRISQFGVAGTPYKSVEEFQKANPAPVIQARKNNLEKMPIINKPLSISNNQQINPDSNVTVPKFQPYTASNNPNIARGYYDLGQGKKVEIFQGGGKTEPYITNDPNDPRIQAYRDSSDLSRMLYSNMLKADSIFNYARQQQTNNLPDNRAVPNLYENDIRLGEGKGAISGESTAKRNIPGYYHPEDLDVPINNLTRLNGVPPEINGLPYRRQDSFFQRTFGLQHSPPLSTPPKQKVILNKPQSKETSKAIGQTWSEKINAPTIKPKAKPKPVQQFQDTVPVPSVTSEAQTQINTGSSTPITLGQSSPDSSTGKRLYRYGNKDITEQEFNKYKTLGKHKIVEYGGGGEIYYSDPNKFIEAQQAYNDSTNYYNFMHSERRKIPHGADPKAWMNSKEANDLLIEESNLQGAVMDRNTRAGVKLGKLPYPTLPVSKPVFRPTHANGGVIDTNTYGKQDVNRSLMQSGEIMQSDTIRDPNVLQKFKSKDGFVPDYLVVNKHNNPTWSEVPEKKGILDYVDDVLSAPQRAATYAVESGLHAVGARKAPPKYENPSDGLNIQNKWGKMATDLVLDPMNLVGIGLFSKGAKEVNAAKRVLNETKSFTKEAASATKNVGTEYDKFAGAFKDYDKIKDYIKAGKVADVNKARDYLKNLKNFDESASYFKHNPTRFYEILPSIFKDASTGSKAASIAGKYGLPIALVNDLITQNSNKIKKDNISWEYKPHYTKPISSTPKNLTTNSKVEDIKPKKEFTKKREIGINSSSNIPVKPLIQKDSTIHNNDKLKDIGKPRRYFVGDRWQSYEELIKSNPNLKDPNVFYNTFHRKAPNDSTGAFTSWKIVN